MMHVLLVIEAHRGGINGKAICIFCRRPIPSKALNRCRIRERRLMETAMALSGPLTKQQGYKRLVFCLKVGFFSEDQILADSGVACRWSVVGKIATCARAAVTR